MRSYPDGRLGIIGECPDSTGRPISIVNVEHPLFVTMGFLCTVLGFMLQVLAIPSTKTIVQIRTELKAAKMAQRLKEEQVKLTRLYPGN